MRAAYSKNGEARTIPMGPVLTETLEGIRINADPTAHVFLTSEGMPYRDISTAFGTALRRAGITNFRFHDLRHTFASRLVMAGVDLTTVKELMGHKTITMTMRYAHLSTDHKRSAIAVLDRFADRVPTKIPTVARVTLQPSLQVIDK